MKINRSLHLGILLALAVALIAACLTVTYLLDIEGESQSNKITPAMLDSMATAANQYAADFPHAPHNVPHECRVFPADVCYDKRTESHVVTCLIPQVAPDSVTGKYLFGTVTIKNNIVTGYGSVEMESQSALSDHLAQLGCK